jgi:ferredoxin
MGQRISRRSFLKGGLAAAAGVAASSIPATKALATPDESKQLATLIDISKCVGCEACVEACSVVNAEKYPDPKKPFP